MESKKLFGTDGIRGVAGKYPLDDNTIRIIGRAAAKVLKKGKKHPVIVIGRDTRESGSKISALLKKEFINAGIDVWDLGVIPTPGVAYIVKKYPVLAGVVISASHNPYKDNGIKFFSHKGTKLSDKLEEEIEKWIHKSEFDVKSAVKGKSISQLPLIKEYEKFLINTFPKGLTLKGKKLVIDCGNGATYKIAKKIFSFLGADVTALNINPDGQNINKDSGALHPQKVGQEVVKQKAFCGLAFDGDGDRIIFTDEKGKIVDGDYMLAISSWFWKQKGKLKNDTLVTTVMANLGLFKAMEEYGIKTSQTKVGDRFVSEEMVKTGAVIGGEQSGHIIFRSFLPTGDGILSAIQFLAVIAETKQDISSLCKLMQKYPQVLINTYVSKKIPLEKLPLTSKIVKKVQDELKDDGRVLVRYSGTETMLRVMVEGKDKNVISSFAKQISESAKKEIDKIN